MGSEMCIRDRSYEGSEIYLPNSGSWETVLDSDAKEFGGYGRLDTEIVHQATLDPSRLHLYLPSRSVQVLTRME